MLLCHLCKQADSEGSLSCACVCTCLPGCMSASMATHLPGYLSHFLCWLGCAGETSVPWNTFVHSNIYDHIICGLWKTRLEIIEHLDCSETMVFNVFQSLLMIFARLMHNQMEAVLEFLTSVPDPMGKPALEFVLKEWCARQHSIYGAYERKVM